MQPNPLLRKLGFTDHDRVAIIHTDDIGMCQATITAFSELHAFGLISSGATMAPCPWFPSVVRYCRDHPDVDMGVHLTLNCEWHSYRWGPVSTRDPASGLLDADGYQWRTVAEAQAHIAAEAGAAELGAQAGQALAAGLDVTHFDTHMGTIVHPKYIAAYLGLAARYGIPVLNLRWDVAAWQRRGMDAETAAATAAMVERLEQEGLPLLDDLVGLDLSRPQERIEQAKAALAALRPGITHFIIHPAADTPELRAIAPDWRARVADFETFRSEELRRYVRDSGIQVIGYRALRAQMRT